METIKVKTTPLEIMRPLAEWAVINEALHGWMTHIWSCDPEAWYPSDAQEVARHVKAIVDRDEWNVPETFAGGLERLEHMLEEARIRIIPVPSISFMTMALADHVLTERKMEGL